MVPRSVSSLLTSARALIVGINYRLQVLILIIVIIVVIVVILIVIIVIVVLIVVSPLQDLLQ